MRIGILTFHRAYNCGAMLQAWALSSVLERMGHVVEFPACNDVGYYPCRFMCQDIPANKKGLQWVRSLLGRLWLDVLGYRTGDRRSREYDAFRKEYLPERVCQPSEFKQHYDLIIIGSDQVFSERHVDKWRDLFYGEVIPEGLPKIAYAGSIGDLPKTGQELVAFKDDLASFSAVSFREPFEDFVVVADPTLLMTAVDYQSLRAKSSSLPKCDYIYFYSIDTTDFEVKCARAIAQALKCKLIISAAYPDERIRNIPEAVNKLSPTRFVEYIRGAKYVLAGSFHGTALSLIHHKPFLTIRNKVNEPLSRPAALLGRLGIPERLVCPSVSVEEMIGRLRAPVPPSAYCALETHRQASFDWLGNAIETATERSRTGE